MMPQDENWLGWVTYDAERFAALEVRFRDTILGQLLKPADLKAIWEASDRWVHEEDQGYRNYFRFLACQGFIYGFACARSGWPESGVGLDDRDILPGNTPE